MPSPLHILQQYWRHNAFRPMQEEIIETVLAEKDCLALLPTGGGKSICFQVPGLIRDGLCLVISPLIALMRDQVDTLNDKGIPAAALHSGLDYVAVRSILQQCTRGDFKFLYVSPERLESELFQEYLPAMDIGLLAVDEAHCISQWGYDFRPPYLRIAAIRKELPGVPLIALTASATPAVQEDIVRQLQFGEHRIFRKSFLRPALAYQVQLTDHKIPTLIRLLQDTKGSAIVYCGTRKQTRDIARHLQLQGISADWYNAGLKEEDRQAKEQSWLQNHTRVMVCTNAFGMGIDKPDVRLVVHYHIPDTLENYYQEAGRAGRDEQKAAAVLLCQPEDPQLLAALPDKRYPSISVIQSVYQSIADYLQLPVGSGEGQYFDFDLQAFSSHFQPDIVLIINVLKVLEQEGHIAFEENIFLPTQVGFITSRSVLEDFEQQYPAIEPLIKILLRTYQGIADNRVSVYEKQLARLARISVEQVNQYLLQMASFGIIEYLPQKQTPQLYFRLNRAPAKYLHIDRDAYLEKKKRYTERVHRILGYLKDTSTCRSTQIGQYFGDNDQQRCGICDNCLRNQPAASQAMISLIQTQLALGSIPLQALMQQLKSFPETQIRETLQWMQEELLIQIDEQGVVRSQK